MICINQINAGKKKRLICWPQFILEFCLPLTRTATCAATPAISRGNGDVPLLMDQILYDAASRRLLLKVIDQHSPP